MTRREGIPTSFVRRTRSPLDDQVAPFVNTVEWGLPRAVELARDKLVWDAHRIPDRSARPSAHLLVDFVRLADAPDSAILKFAERWGPMWLCGHGIPWQAHFAWRCEVARIPGRPGWCMEALSDWRWAARDAQATLRIAGRLRNGQLADPREWAEVRGRGSRLFGFGILSPVREGPWQPDEEWDPDQERQRARLRRHERFAYGGTTLDHQYQSFWNVMDGWLLRGGVRPFFEWEGTPERAPMKPSIRLAGWSLYGAIAVQLLFEVARTEGLAICASCGAAYVPPVRRPRWDQNNYCPDCGKRAAMRDASARYRRTAKYRQTRATRYRQAPSANG